MFNTRLALPLLAALGGCSSLVDPATTSSDGAALSLTLAHAPDGIDCISLTFASEDGTVTQVQRAMTYQNVTVNNLASGAYYLSALAYSSGMPAPITDDACGSAPMRAPWGTEEPAPLVLQQGVVTRTSLTLVPTGSVVVHPVFVDTPQVIAQAQGAVGALAAGQGLVAWLVAGSGATGKVVTMNDAPGSLPVVQSSTQTNPSEIVIDPVSRAVAWTNAVSGARDSSGHFVNDGSVWTWNGLAVQQVAANLAPSDLQYGNSMLFWGDLATNAIECTPCTAPLATGQATPNALTAHGARIYWDNGQTGALLGMNNSDVAPALLGTSAPRIPAALAADDTDLYYLGAAPGDASAALAKIPATGGAETVLLADVPNAFPIAVFGGYVYFDTGSAIGRVPTTGGAREDLVDGVLGGFAVSTDSDGHTVLTWADATHGGLIWRARLD